MRRVSMLFFLVPSCAFALGQVLPAPPASQAFGTEVVFLPNGNFVVTDPSWSGTAEEAGAVYLYAPDGTRISRLTGSRTGDSVGDGGIVVLANGNFVVRSPFWDAGVDATDAGAVTFGDADTGFGNGADVAVSAANSLVGAKDQSRVGSPGVYPLPNGHYVVASDHWWTGVTIGLGAVTWGNGDTGTSGVVDAGNSLVGSALGDHVGFEVTVLPNGNYVVASPLWNHGALADAGAVTLRPGDAVAPAVVAADNSIIGDSALDHAGIGGVFVVGNDAVIASPDWDDGAALNAGAVTWMSGTVPLDFVIGADNSFVGSTKSDSVGSKGVIALAGGSYAFASPFWDRVGLVDAGAITVVLVDGEKNGVVDDTNSIVGARAGDAIGSGGVTALPGGGLVALSPEWSTASVEHVGAATWIPGDGSSTGTLDGANSLRGSFAGDLQFSSIVVLENGNYVLRAPFARVGAVPQAGAVAWCPQSQPCVKVLGPTTAFVGATGNDLIGAGGVVPLSDGNYAIASGVADTALAVDAGAATWGDGTQGIAGTIAPANSIFGRATDDCVGSGEHVALPDGGLLLFSTCFAAPGAPLAGAATFLPAGQPFTGVIDESNSSYVAEKDALLGLNTRAIATADGRVIVAIPRAPNGALLKAGAIAVLDPAHTGALDLDAGFRGNVADGGALMRFDWHEASKRLVASDPASSRVWLATLPPTSLPAAIFRDGFED